MVDQTAIFPTACASGWYDTKIKRLLFVRE
ncbi:hypothetical protein Pan189_04810 [Stratiformator vulcanicus]|uniref:Uncharacterized protein n=1 Tax=Stratiformator vulcanicus TaxID=2527980 RepID=A0A517QWT0_9PLAN|nr:hypothetical protein Pan189_04810 [Stratiformator vulcanicus]